MGDVSHRRLLHEASTEGRIKESDGVRLEPCSDNLYEWRAELTPAKESLFHGVTYVLKLTLPPNYPMEPPKAHFQTRIFHPNIHGETGEVCLDVFQDKWSPMWTLRSACLAVLVLLDTPCIDSPLNCDAGNLLRCGDRLGYHVVVRAYVHMAHMAANQNAA